MVWNRFHLTLAVVYIAGLLLVGILAGRQRRDSSQFLNATGALPLWVCIAASIAANCGSLDMFAMMALGAQYGMLACHFYWIGAIPALLVMVFWLLPAYAHERYPTILDFIARCYGSETRSLAALGMAAMMLLLSGVCLCAVAQLVTSFLGWSFLQAILLTVPVVLLYTSLGGIRATVYNQLIHFSVVLIAVVPLSVLVIRQFGGVTHLLSSLPSDRGHLWQTLPFFAPQATMDRFGLIVGLGLVLSFGYWSTDFVQMQRALAVRRVQDVPYVPLAQAFAKLIFAFLIVIPGVIAPLVLPAQDEANWNATLPSMMLHYYSPSWIVIGFMGLTATLISTFANNVSGFTAAWVQGVYRPWIRPGAGEGHYLGMSRMTNAAACLLSIGAAYMALTYHSLMEYMQMIFSTFNAPLLALVVLAALAPRRAAQGGVGGFTVGLASTALHQALVRAGLLYYGSQMNANFYTAILGFCIAVAGTLLTGLVRKQTAPAHTMGVQPIRLPLQFSMPTILLAAGIAAVCVALNVLFW